MERNKINSTLISKASQRKKTHNRVKKSGNSNNVGFNPNKIHSKSKYNKNQYNCIIKLDKNKEMR